MSGIYDGARQKLLTAALDWRAQSLIVSAWQGAPDFNPADMTIASITGRGGVEAGTSLDMTGLAVSANGTAASQPVVIPGIAAAVPVGWFTIAQKNASHAASALLLFIDTIVPPLPFIGNGLDLVLQPDWLSAQGWFRP
jgi:hypothetical protein